MRIDRIATWLLIFTVAVLCAYAQGPDYNQTTHKPIVSVTGTPYFADPTGVRDSTTALQNCINYSAANRAVCGVPPGIYKHSGLTMTSGQPSLQGMQNQGSGSATLIYTGSTTALTMGNCSNTSTFLYSTTLSNITITVPNSATAQYGLQVCGVSQSNWSGLIVGGNSTSGYFTVAATRFYDSSEIDCRNCEWSQLTYHSGTTAILFDDYKLFGNALITIEGGEAAINKFQYGMAFRSCISCTFGHGFLFEGNDYSAFVDNSTWAMGATNDGIFNVTFDTGTRFLTGDIAGPTHNVVLQVNSPSGGALPIQNLNFISTATLLTGTTAEPFVLNIPSVASGSIIDINIISSYMNGVGTAVLSCNNSAGIVSFLGLNTLLDDTGTGTRPPDQASGGTCQVTDSLARNINQFLLSWTDPSGALISANSQYGSRPSATALFPGLFFCTALGPLGTSDDGFCRFGGGGASTGANKTYIDVSGPNAVPDLNQTIDMFANGAKVTRTDAFGFHPTAINVLTDDGSNNAIASGAAAFNPPLANGLVVTVILGHTLQAGSNTFAYNGGGAVAIKSSLNAANNIGTAYAATGIIQMMYGSTCTCWLDLKQ